MMKKYIFFTLIPIIIISENSNCLCKELKSLVLTNLNMRIKPDIRSKSIMIIPKGTIVENIEKSTNIETIDGYNDYWYKVKYLKKTGWIYGGYIVEYIGQDKEEIFKIYDFINYFLGCNRWECSLSGRNSYVILKLGFPYKKIDKNQKINHLGLDFEINKDGDTLYAGFQISNIIRSNNGYDLFTKGKFCARIVLNGDKLKIIDIIPQKTERYGKNFNTLELVGLNFEKANIYINDSD